MRFDDELLSRHVLFVGAIGSGKTVAMMQLIAALRKSADPTDVFVVFDTKGDFKEKLFQPGDAILSNERTPHEGSVVWNLAEDVSKEDPTLRGEEIFEIATTIFAEGIEGAGDNMYFAVGARDVFAAVVEALMLQSQGDPLSNREIRLQLEASQRELWELLENFPHLSGAKRYLSGDGQGPRAILAFLQQQVRAAFSGVFGTPGDFSVRRFVREKGTKALFVEFDISSGSLLLPVYRVLIDLAIKESLGRSRTAGNVFFIMDEFAVTTSAHAPCQRHQLWTKSRNKVRGRYAEHLASDLGLRRRGSCEPPVRVRNCFRVPPDGQQ